jgi:hypothetical protein
MKTKKEIFSILFPHHIDADLTYENLMDAEYLYNNSDKLEKFISNDFNTKKDIQKEVIDFIQDNVNWVYELITTSNNINEPVGIINLKNDDCSCLSSIIALDQSNTKVKLTEDLMDKLREYSRKCNDVFEGYEITYIRYMLIALEFTILNKTPVTEYWW